jgi:hypothetical protein
MTLLLLLLLRIATVYRYSIQQKTIVLGEKKRQPNQSQSLCSRSSLENKQKSKSEPEPKSVNSPYMCHKNYFHSPLLYRLF